MQSQANLNNLQVSLFAKHINGNVTALVVDSWEKAGWTMLTLADAWKAGQLTLVHGAYSYTNAEGLSVHVDISRDLRGSGIVQDLKATAAY